MRTKIENIKKITFGDFILKEVEKVKKRDPKFTVYRLARECAIDAGQMWRIINNRHGKSPSLKTALRVMDALDLNYEMLREIELDLGKFPKLPPTKKEERQMEMDL